MALPKGFVYLSDVDPSIKQEMFYASDFNFVGRPIKGYNKPVAILTQQAAHALKKVQDEVKLKGLSLKVIDAYRPHRAVEDFWNWALDPSDTKMKDIFYPKYSDKSKIFSDGYLAKFSGHSRGSTVDLTLVDSNGKEIDMGSQIDMLDEISNTVTDLIPPAAQKNRLYLKEVMERQGFDNYRKEWWHFALLDEPFPRKPEDHFDFPVE
jgi:D-alanyl-D-alanine dipeptidase